MHVFDAIKWLVEEAMERKDKFALSIEMVNNGYFIHVRTFSILNEVSGA